MRLFGRDILPGIFRSVRQQDPETTARWSWAEAWAGLRAAFGDHGAALDPSVPESEVRQLWDASGRAAPPALAGRADRAGGAEVERLRSEIAAMESDRAVGRWPWSRKPAPPAPDPAALERQRLRDQIAALETERAAQVRQALEREAEAFAIGLVRTGRAFPAERAAIVSAHLAAATMTGGGDALAQLERTYTSRPPHILAAELVPIGEGGELPADPKPGATLTRERRDALLALSNLGRATLSNRK